MGGEFTRARVWERFYIAISRDRAFIYPHTTPKSDSVSDRIANPEISRFARKRRLTARLQIDARPSRDGFEQFGSSTRKHTANLSRPSGVSLNAEQRHLVLEVRAIGLCAFKWGWGAQLSAPLGKATRSRCFLSG